MSRSCRPRGTTAGLPAPPTIARSSSNGRPFEGARELSVRAPPRRYASAALTAEREVALLGDQVAVCVEDLAEPDGEPLVGRLAVVPDTEIEHLVEREAAIGSDVDLLVVLS